MVTEQILQIEEAETPSFSPNEMPHRHSQGGSVHYGPAVEIATLDAIKKVVSPLYVPYYVPTGVQPVECILVAGRHVWQRFGSANTAFRVHQTPRAKLQLNSGSYEEVQIQGRPSVLVQGAWISWDKTAYKWDSDIRRALLVPMETCVVEVSCTYPHQMPRSELVRVADSLRALD